MARDSPVWRAAEEAGGPLLVGDVASSPVRAGGFVQTLGLKAYVAMPLMTAGGPVGMVMCGDSSRVRQWSEHDCALARQLAAEGALVVGPGGQVEHLSPRPATVRDTTGAGDTFNGVLAAHLAAGADLGEAARAANVAAALSVGHTGARAGMPTAAAVAEALEQ